MYITKEQAMEIAEAAMKEAGYHVTQYAGYFEIWRDDKDIDTNYAVAINKEDGYFAIYVSPPLTEDGWWEYTNDLNIIELAEKLMDIALDIELEEKG